MSASLLFLAGLTSGQEIVSQSTIKFWNQDFISRPIISIDQYLNLSARTDARKLIRWADLMTAKAGMDKRSNAELINK